MGLKHLANELSAPAFSPQDKEWVDHYSKSGEGTLVYEDVEVPLHFKLNL